MSRTSRLPDLVTDERRPGKAVFLLLVVGAVVLAGCSSPGTDPTRTEGTTAPEGTTSPSDGGTTNGTGWTVTVVEVVDGDTVKFRYANGTTDTGRLLGVDTPEVHVPNEPAEFEGVPDDDAGASCLRDWGHKASEFARAELLGEEVIVTLDGNEGPRDRYDRLLTYVRVDGESFNYELVEQGYARVYDSRFTRRDRFYAAESRAQREGVGLWECRDARTTRPATDDAPLAVDRIREDASGNDHDNRNGEYVVLRNAGSDPLDLSGWTVSDESGHAYTIPSGFTLAPDGTVTLYSGSGSNSASELYWDAERAVWNNGGDTVVVERPDGTVVVREEY